MSQLGPTKVTRAWESCLGCTMHVQRMLKSGRDPEFEHFCKHPLVSTVNAAIVEVTGFGNYIGESDDTPAWCPVKTGKS
jgi:hypothetical protein